MPADGSTAMVAMNPVGGNAVGKLVAVDPRVSQLVALAKELGYALSPLETMRKELSVSISTRLVTRVGIDVYQTAAYNIPMFSREAALQIFAACKMYHRPSDRYKSKILLFNPHAKLDVIKVPRIAPPRGKLVASFRKIEATLGIESGEDGLLALRSWTTVVQELVAREAIRQEKLKPSLPFAIGGSILKVTLVLSFDATGYGAQQFNTIAARNPQESKSAQNLNIFGLGNVDDGRDGSSRLFGANLALINENLQVKREGKPIELEIDKKLTKVDLDILVVTDVSALRHCEHVANSGWCGCSSDFALRQTPRKPTNKAEMIELCGKCIEPTVEQRDNWSHMPPPGETLPRPCTAPGCTYAHDRAMVGALLAEMLATEATLKADTSAKGKAKFAEWRKAHHRLHFNVQPGLHGKPMLRHDLAKQILDALHKAELGLPKTPWKFGILNNASDDAREGISKLLAEWKHPLDTRRKDNGRARHQKWFTGEKWASFCAGLKGSPGGPPAMAAIVKIIADDLQECGVDMGAEAATAATAVTAVAAPQVGGRGSGGRGRAGGGGRSGGRGRGRVAFTAAQPSNVQAAGVPVASAAQLRHVPTALERMADEADLKIIRDLYGSRAQTLINALLSFDGYLAWYYPFKKSIAFLCDMETRELRALENCQTAIDMHEIFERVSVRHHKSYLPHGAIFKTTRDIMMVGDVWAVDTSPLELQNAETKRVAATSATRNQHTSTSGTWTASMRGNSAGPAPMVKTTGNSTSQALGTLRTLLSAQKLRRGEGPVVMAASRRNERLFGADGRGRIKQLSIGVKMEKLGDNYNPKEDTCIKAFVRLLAQCAVEVEVVAVAAEAAE